MKILILTIISILMLLFWCNQFLKLMRMEADDFPSKEDKSIWAATLIFLNVLGAFIFWINFRPKEDMIPNSFVGEDQFVSEDQYDDHLYEELKTKFPAYTEEIEKSLQLSSREKSSLERYYSSRIPSALLRQYRKDPSDIGPGCYGILLATLVLKKLK